MANCSWFVVCTLFFAAGLNFVVANTSPKVSNSNSASTEWKYKGRSVRINPSNQTLPTSTGTKVEPKSSATVNQPLKYENDKDVRRIANAFSPLYSKNNNKNNPQQSKNVSTVFNSRRKLPKFSSSTKINRLPTKPLSSSPPAFRHPKLKNGKVIDNATNLNSSESKQYYGYEDRAWHVPYFYPNHDHGREGEQGSQNSSQPMVELIDGPAALANDSPQDDYGNAQDDGVDYDDDDGGGDAATANANQDPNQQPQQQPQQDDDNTQDDDNEHDNDQDSQSIMEEVDAEVDAADPDDPDNHNNNQERGDDEEDD